MDVERFSTDPFPLDRRFTVWDEALRQAGLGVEPEAEPPSGRLVRRIRPHGTAIVLVAGAPQRLVRTLKPGSDRVWLGLFLEGAGRLPGGEVAQEGDLLCWPAGCGPLCRPLGRFRLVLLSLSRLDPRWGGLPEAEDEASSLILHPKPRPVVSGLFATIADAAEEEAEGVLAALESALAEIISPALGGGLMARATLRRRILRAIECRLHNPRLNLARFAEAEGMSARAVQKLLEDDGRTFSQHLRSRRLARAAGLLADPAQAALAVGEIGFRCGFPDPAHFSRAFRQHYGTTPSIYRAGAQAPAVTAAFTPPSLSGMPTIRSISTTAPTASPVTPTQVRLGSGARNQLS